MHTGSWLLRQRERCAWVENIKPRNKSGGCLSLWRIKTTKKMKVSVEELSKIISELPDPKTFQKYKMGYVAKYITDDGDVNKELFIHVYFRSEEHTSEL